MSCSGRNATRFASFTLCLTLVAAAAAGGSRVAAGFQETRTLAADELVLNNLIGEITVTGHAGSAFEIAVDVQGRDGTRESGLKIVTREGSRGELTIQFPSAKRYVYPRLGSGSNTSLRSDRGERSWLGAILGELLGERITVSGSGSGLEIWADVEIKVPHGKTLVVRHGVGGIAADDVRGALTLDNRSGHVTAMRIDGDLLVDTGSGHVEVAEVGGRLEVDTGSGHVEIRDCRGPTLLVDTGSGHVNIDRADVNELRVDTGSGHVEAFGVSTDSADIDTGSGQVTLVLERMGAGRYRVDTGSGGITLKVPRAASLDVVAESGNGGVDLALEDVTLTRKERDEVAFTMGGGGSRVRLDTGSGGIRIAYSD